MKKIIIIAILLLTGCCALLPLGGSKDELEFVPKPANLVVILRPSAIFNDPDFPSLDSQYDITSQMNKLEENSGIDLTKLDRFVLFTNSDSSTSYGGFIARGPIKKDDVVENIAVDNIITNTTYGGHVIYEITPKEAGNGSYLSFLDDNTFVLGSKDAVKDSIDVSSGKLESVKSRQNLSQTYDALDKKSLLILLMDVSPKMKKDIKNLKGIPFNADAMSRMKCAGLSLARGDANVSLEVLVTADDSASASGISNSLGKVISLIKVNAPSGSATESVIERLNVKTKGNTVTVTLPSTFDDLKQMVDELQSSSAP
jgi:hypothetical protein